MLGLVFGVTVYAASTVLACFMAGLALGSYFGGRLADRSRRPLVVFARVEALIGLMALATPLALGGVEWLYLQIHPALSGVPGAPAVVRPLLAGLVLIWPAALMGATFPLVLRSQTRALGSFGTTASLFYGVNTAGAIAGAIAGGLWLVPNIGVSWSFRVGALVNFAIAAVVWTIARRASGSPPLPAVEEAPTTSDAAVSGSVARAVLAALTVSGFVSLALEIIWFRVLVFFLRPTTYAFAFMLAGVLGGIAAGSLAITPFLKRRWNWVVAFGSLQIAVAIAGLLSFAVIASSYGLLVWPGWSRIFPSPFDYLLSILSVAGVSILPVSLLLGAAFPIGLRLWAAREGAAAIGRRTGLVYALNVGAGIAGSLIAGFLLVPWLGAQWSLIAVTAAALATGLLVLVRERGRAALGLAAAGIIAFGAIALTLPDVFSRVIADRYPDQRVLWHREGAQATVTVTELDSERTLLIDGVHHASDGAGMTQTHRLIGALGVALHPNPRKVLVIGLGGGVTASGASILPTAQTHVVELVKPVVDGAHWFERANHNVLRRPNVRVQVADGRNFLLLDRQHYDVIMADLILPEFAGSASLYSADYFRLVTDRLTQDGLVVQWLTANSQYQYRLMLRTFLSAVPYATMWAGGGLVVGSRQPIRLSREGFDWKLKYPGVREVFASLRLGTFEDLVGQYVAGPDALRAFAGEGPLLTDDVPIIEYFLSLPRGGPPRNIRGLKGDPREILAGPQRP